MIYSFKLIKVTGNISWWKRLHTMSTILQLIFLLGIFITAFYVAESGKTRGSLFVNSPCGLHQFKCSNNRCISKNQYCNLIDDCGDNSDETYCYVPGLCEEHGLAACARNQHKECIPRVWYCDGIQDCPYNIDELSCDSHSDGVLTASQIFAAINKASTWLLSKRNNQSRTFKWGSNVPRIATALFLSKPDFLKYKKYINEMTYELNLSLLSKLALKKIEDVPTSELALYVNAFLLYCIDPRKFYVLDLLKELRKRVDSSDSTNPMALMALCNAQETLTEADVTNLVNTFWESNSKFRIDKQAVVIMALACAQKQGMTEHENLSEMTLELKKKQDRNGTVENLKTTALIMQALFASETESDDDNFDEMKALHQIIRSQEKDGSFGSVLNTYYVLPVLNYMSLVNISSEHCHNGPNDENEVLEILRNQVGEKWSVKFSLWIGEDKVLQRSIALSVPANTSFYGIMEYASDLDEKYKFQFTVRNTKPFIFALSGISDDAAMETYWLPYFILNETARELKPINTSVADVYPKNDDHLLFWYREDV